MGKTYFIVHGIRVAQNFVPETFGRLTTIGPRFLLLVGKKRYAHQVFVCQCGNFGCVRTNSLYSENTTSCGCRKQEQRVASPRSRVPQYHVWKQIKSRCTNPRNPDYVDYGGRGIRVCDRWLEPETGFINFLADMGERPSPKHSIDRKDNDGNYCPENCRWATQKEQTRNQRGNTLLTYQGKTQCVAAWTEELGMPKRAISSRLFRGWSVEKSLTTPIKRNGKI